MSVKEPTILIVEDDNVLQRALVKAFKGQELEVVTASDGKEGLMYALEHHPNVILLDEMLPTLGGMEVLKRLREDAWGKDASIIFFTNKSAVEEHIIEGIAKYQPQHYLIKSDWKVSEIVNKITELLK